MKREAPKVVQLQAGSSSIPAMLRALADDIEQGREGPYRCVIAVAQPVSTMQTPEQFLWGASVPNTEHAGILMFAAQQALSAVAVKG